MLAGKFCQTINFGFCFSALTSFSLLLFSFLCLKFLSGRRPFYHLFQPSYSLFFSVLYSPVLPLLFCNLSFLLIVSGSSANLENTCVQLVIKYPLISPQEYVSMNSLSLPTPSKNHCYLFVFIHVSPSH